jgi:hypothetical protein
VDEVAPLSGIGVRLMSRLCANERQTGLLKPR